MTWNERYPTYCSMIETTLPQYLPSVELPQGKVSEAFAIVLPWRCVSCAVAMWKLLCHWPVP